ncbi:MAG TPA: histidine kinase [Gammaproteobacteria bacterium]
MPTDQLSPTLLARFSLRRQLLLVFLFNCAIALFLTVVFGERFGHDTLWFNFLYSQCIGLSIHGITHLAALLAGRGRQPRPRDMAAGILFGTAGGILLGALATGTWQGMLAMGWSAVGLNLFLSVIFGTLAGFIYFTTLRNAQTRVRLKEQELRNLSAEKALTETRLRLLQAQIEPHFLFNTLSNIHGLIESHPARAGRMLESLIHYLRATLQRSREGRTTLGDELELVRAYLAIQQERMGERLRWHIAVPEGLLGQPLPPMLIQPLVENAVTHGIEPALKGGAVEVAVEAAEGELRICVADTGNGSETGGERAGLGLGLSNTAARLATLYGARAAVTLESNPPHGARARLTLPWPLPPHDLLREVV